MNWYIIGIVYAVGLIPAYLVEKRFNKWIAKDPDWVELPALNAWFLSWLTVFAMTMVFILEPREKEA